MLHLVTGDSEKGVLVKGGKTLHGLAVARTAAAGVVCGSSSAPKSNRERGSRPEEGAGSREGLYDLWRMGGSFLE